jgi:chemotaxis protein methyltransferase CheR
LLYACAGISLADEKKIMVASRLAKRLQYYGLASYAQYYQLINQPEYKHEFQVMIDILTTNETYFFREPAHFEYLKDPGLKTWQGDPFKAWSAASSSGEEAYSLAIVLAETLGSKKWTVLGSDISTRVLDIARNGVYLMDRLENMDKRLLERYCLRGVRSQDGFFCVDEKLRSRTSFEQINLVKPLSPALKQNFDVIFLRNVLIYFDQETKKDVVDRITEALKPGGYFFISHSENLHHITDKLEMLKPSIFIKK